MNDIYEIAKLIQFNSQSEAKAVLDYTELIRVIENSSLGEEDKQRLTDLIKELIADELNHENVLQEIYTFLTNIEAKKE